MERCVLWIGRKQFFHEGFLALATVIPMFVVPSNRSLLQAICPIDDPVLAERLTAENFGGTLTS